MSLLTAFAASVAAFAVLFAWMRQRQLRAQEARMSRQLYELRILQELGDRIGYSLNIQNIADIITGSLRQFLQYSAVASMLLQPEKLVFKVHAEQAVSRKFIDDMRDRMLGSLSALLDRQFQQGEVAEVLSGAMLAENAETPIRSFFNIPLAIGERVAGVITVAHAEAGHFAEEEMTLLYKITKHASLAVTRLHDVVETEQRKLSAMIASMTEGIVTTDADYRIVAVNPAAKRAVGIDADKTDVTLFDFLDRLDGEFDIRGRLEESMKLDKVLEEPEVLIGERYFQIFVAPVKGTVGLEKGNMLGGVVIFRDITHDKELARLRDDFTAMIVHELRSPLTGINKLAEVMSDKRIPMDEKAQAENTALIYEESARMIALVNNLLDVARLQAGKFEMTRVPSDLCAIIEDRTHVHASIARDAGISLRQTCDARISRSAPLDAARITQVLSNLIANAFQFTERGGEVRIEALLHRSGQSVADEAAAVGISWPWAGSETRFAKIPDSMIVAVADTGVGIPAAEIPLLFSKFKQVRRGAAQRGKNGAGLGLVIAKGLVEAHGGFIGVSSQEGVGSTFYFTLPIR